MQTMVASITYKKTVRTPVGARGPAISFHECYFELVEPAAEADVLACLYRKEPVAGWRSYPGATRLIDLRPEPERIFAGLPKDTRYEINRAREKDGIETSVATAPGDLELENFMDYYDAFAGSKGVPPVSRPQLLALHAAGKLALSFASSSGGALLASHAYILDHDRARLTHSASLFRLEQDARERGQIGRANRLLHWNDAVTFRDRGVICYDFGGWYEGHGDEALLRINSFKKEFGGEIVNEWSSFGAGSVVGSLYLTVRDLMLRTKR